MGEGGDGKLVALRTKEETRSGNDTIDVYVLEVPAKYANHILGVVKEAIPNQDSIDLQHLRRFAKGDFLPQHLRKRPTAFIQNSECDDSCDNANSLHLQNFQDGHGTGLPAKKYEPSLTEQLPTLHLLVSPVNLIAPQDLLNILTPQPPFLQIDSLIAASVPDLRIIPVPALAPTSAQQAERWSSQYWPTIYRRSNPFGPHPSVVSHAEAEIIAHLPARMRLAHEVAESSRCAGLGEQVGCVILERKDGKDEVVVVAGDARWERHANEERSIGKGNVMAHAVMRAIGMVARKRQRIAPTTASGPTNDTNLLNEGSFDESQQNGRSHQLVNNEKKRRDIFLDLPLTTLETIVFEKNNLAPHGYLCLDLEIYITHEPCVMCSMAILHSRFGRCVFGQVMPLTGGLTAETIAEASEDASEATFDATKPKLDSESSVGNTEDVSFGHRYEETKRAKSLGYGLFWRDELNWKFLTWQWIQQGGNCSNTVPNNIHV